MLKKITVSLFTLMISFFVFSQESTTENKTVLIEQKNAEPSVTDKKKIQMTPFFELINKTSIYANASPGTDQSGDRTHNYTFQFTKLKNELDSLRGGFNVELTDKLSLASYLDNYFKATYTADGTRLQMNENQLSIGAALEFSPANFVSLSFDAAYCFTWLPTSSENYSLLSGFMLAVGANFSVKKANLKLNLYGKVSPDFTVNASGDSQPMVSSVDSYFRTLITFNCFDFLKPGINSGLYLDEELELYSYLYRDEKKGELNWTDRNYNDFEETFQAGLFFSPILHFRIKVAFYCYYFDSFYDDENKAKAWGYKNHNDFQLGPHVQLDFLKLGPAQLSVYYRCKAHVMEDDTYYSADFAKYEHQVKLTTSIRF